VVVAGSGNAGNEAAVRIISAPGHRYHPAVLAQANATVGLTYAGCFRFAVGSGEAVEAKLYSRLEKPVPLYGAAMSEDSAREAGQWSDGLLTVGNADVEAVCRNVKALRDLDAVGKPVVLQAALSWQRAKR